MADKPQNEERPNPGDEDDWRPPRGAKSGMWEDERAPAEKKSDGGATGQPKPAGQQPIGEMMKPMVESFRQPAAALWNDPRGKPLVLISMLGVLLVCGLSCFVFSVALLSGGPLVPGPGPQPTSAVAGLPTPGLTSTVSLRANETPLPAAAPTKLTIRNASFGIEPFKLERGQWSYDRNAAKTAFWAPGTLVNYVLGVQASNENRAVFESLNPGDLIVLDTSVGPQRFRVSEKQQIKVDDETPFRNQLSPQLTLVLLGESGNQRRIAIAKFTDEGTPNTLVSSGVPINLGDAQVRAANSRVLQGAAAGLPPDKNFYQVNFQVTNLTTRTLDAGQFTSVLLDPQGNKFAISQQGSLAGGAPGWVNGQLRPGATMTGTAGFEVPANLPAGKLEWTFALDSVTPYVGRVSIPYRPIFIAPTPAPTSAPVAEVTILGATLSPEGNALRVVGTVRNLTNNFLNVGQKDVSLNSGANSALLNTALPAMPWNIPAGETLAFQLTYSRPPGGQPAIFTLLGKTFEINGL